MDRLFSIALTLAAVVTLTFFMMHAVPGGPFVQDKEVPQEVVAVLEAKYHLNDPLYKQYLNYVGGILRWDLGPSYQKVGLSVNDIINASFPVSMKLGGIAVLVVLLLGIPAGILSAVKRDALPDHVIRLIVTLGQTIPNFVLATLLIYIFSAHFRILPSYGLRTWKHYILPVMALSGYSLSFVARLTRSSMLETLQQDYIRTARAKGVPEFQVIFKHALRNSLIPIVTLLGGLIPSLIGGSVIIESIFSIPGIGQYYVTAVNNQDLSIIMGETVIIAALYIGVLFITDLLYVVVDPRISLTGKSR